MRFTWVELVIILAIVLLVFGAGKLPSIAKTWAGALLNSRRLLKAMRRRLGKEETNKSDVKTASTKEKP